MIYVHIAFIFIVVRVYGLESCLFSNNSLLCVCIYFLLSSSVHSTVLFLLSSSVRGTVLFLFLPFIAALEISEQYCVLLLFLEDN